MTKVNWYGIEKSAKKVKKLSKDFINLNTFLSNKTDDGIFLDIKKRKNEDGVLEMTAREVSVEGSRDPSLRRFVQVLDTYLYISSDKEKEERDYILKKKVEIENEIEKRRSQE